MIRTLLPTNDLDPGQAQLVGYRSRLIDDDAMRLEYRVYVAGRPPSIVGQGHGSPADDIDIGDDTLRASRSPSRRKASWIAALPSSGLSLVMRR